MAIKRGSKVNAQYSAASMTDIVFLLLVFLLISTTLINPNALKLVLPKSANQLNEKPYTTVSITSDGQYYIERTPVSEDGLESSLKAKLEGMDTPTISVHSDETADFGHVVKVMDIAVRNNYKLIVATRSR